MRKHLVSSTQMRMSELLREALDQQEISQAELARQAGVSLKHVNQVMNGKAGAQQGQLDYWAWLLGLRFEVTLVSISE